MKKVLLFLGFLLLTVGLFAQEKVISVGGTTGVVNATTTTQRKVAAYTYTWQVDINAPVLYTYSVNLQDLGGAPANNTATAILSGSLENTKWKVITSVSYTGTGTDTTILGSLTSAPLTYKYYKWVVTPSDTIWVGHVLMNFQPFVK